MSEENKKRSYLTDDLDISGNIQEFDDLEEEKEEESAFYDEKTFDHDAKKEEKEEESVQIHKSKLVLIKKLLENIKENNDKISKLLSGMVSEEDERIAIGQISERENRGEDVEAEGKIIEGVFDGENMIGPDGKQYSVPANYASKSKLVEGDILKLTITNSGTFVYKQIGPIERIRVVGVLEKDDEGSFFVNSEGKKWRVLPASVTYFKGDFGDEVVLLIPKTGESKWGAVENIIKNPEN